MEPIGNEKLGFGWWLRCYKCQKKFWLSNTKVIQLTATPIKANSPRQVKKISRLNLNVRKKTSKKFYVISSIIVLLSCAGYYKRDMFSNLVTNRISNINKSTITSLQLANVAYRLETVNNQNKIYITGFILNNTATIIPINGVKVIIYSNSKEMDSWQIKPDAKNAIPGDRIFFSGEKIIEKIYPNIQVGVSIL